MASSCGSSRRNCAYAPARQSASSECSSVRTMIVSGQPYDESKAFDSTPAATARRLKNLQNQALTLNMKLVPA